jgi:DNA phosphorothioation-dependent restriction protein DptH
VKGRLTPDQRHRVMEMLDQGLNRESIAAAVGISPGQVSAVAAHRTMGTYTNSAQSNSPVADKHETVVPVAHDTRSTDQFTVPLGVGLDDGEVVIWAPYQSTNPHVLIVGESGFGKTYAASRLIVELARVHLPSIVFDYGQGFSLENASGPFRDSVRTLEFDLTRNGIALNPLQIFPVDTHGPATVAQRVADTFLRVYPRLGVQQHAALRQAVLDVLADAGIVTADSRTWKLPPPPFRDVEQKLLQYGAAADTVTRKAAASAASHISTLFFFDTFRKTGQNLTWSDLLAGHSQVWILQLGGLEASVERAVTEFLLWSLLRYFEVIGPGPLRTFVVLDEAHKLAFGPGSPVEKILREGRKFGLGVILASQQPEDFNSVAFANTATKIVFQIADQSGRIARQLQRKVLNGHSYEYIASRINTLPRATAYVVTNNRGFVTKMFSFEERGL